MENRKGSLADLIFIPVLIFAFGIVFLVTMNMNLNITNALQNTTTIQENQQANQTIGYAKETVAAGDYWLVLAIIGVLVGADLLVMFLNSHPVFLFAGILFMIIGAYMAYAIFTGAVPSMHEAGLFDNAGMSYTLFQVLPFLFLANGIVFLVLFYAKTPEMI